MNLKWIGVSLPILFLCFITILPTHTMPTDKMAMAMSPAKQRRRDLVWATMGNLTQSLAASARRLSKRHYFFPNMSASARANGGGAAIPAVIGDTYNEPPRTRSTNMFYRYYYTPYDYYTFYDDDNPDHFGWFLSTTNGGPCIILIHGFTSGVDDYPNSVQMRESLWAIDPNTRVIVCDWRQMAEGPDYFVACANTWVVGEAVAWCMYCLVRRKAIDLDTTRIVGFSLGAHCAGNAGYWYQYYYANWAGARCPRICGLDPAGPLWEGEREMYRLDSSDASFVQVHHTGASLLGIWIPCGHSDVYVNGGKSQPQFGWWEDLTGSASHAAACDYYIESLYNTEKYGTFMTTHDEVDQDQCRYPWNPKTGYYGYYCPASIARGIYCCKTEDY